MRRGIKTNINLERGFAATQSSRDGHLRQMQLVNSQAFEDLHALGLEKGQITGMLDTKRGSRCHIPPERDLAL